VLIRCAPTGRSQSLSGSGSAPWLGSALPRTPFGIQRQLIKPANPLFLPRSPISGLLHLSGLLPCIVPVPVMTPKVFFRVHHRDATSAPHQPIPHMSPLLKTQLAAQPSAVSGQEATAMTHRPHTHSNFDVKDRAFRDALWVHIGRADDPDVEANLSDPFISVSTMQSHILGRLRVIGHKLLACSCPLGCSPPRETP
jgi:hypothetical protein